MARNFLLRGMIVGLVAGLVAFVVAVLIGEPSVASAIALESAHDAPAGEPNEHAVLSRTLQSTIGLLTATVGYGVALGGVFALVVAAALGRLGTRTARGTAALVALGGFVAVFLVPFLTYPPNPPAIGSPDTLGRRTALHFAMIAVFLALVFLAVRMSFALRARWGEWDAAVLAVLAFVAATALTVTLMPAVDEVPTDFPATLLWHFRLATVGIQAALWATLGLLFGALTERELRRTQVAQPTPALR